MGDLPQKLFFRIGEVAGLVGVEPHVLRYWEREFRSIRPTKSAKGQRVYSRKDVENLLRVRDLLYRDGFTIAGAKKRLLHPNAAIEPETDVEAHADAAEVETDAVDPASEPIVAVANETVREKLIALRDEVEEFLAELSSTPTHGD
jgi:DNA-binding transcriptional MerR regulator